MPSDHTTPGPPACSAPDCGLDAAFRVYDPDGTDWRPICDRHARRLHPSLERNAWLEAGLMRPIELEPPDGPPAEPRGGRAHAFRAEVATLMGWDDAVDASDGNAAVSGDGR